MSLLGLFHSVNRSVEDPSLLHSVLIEFVITLHISISDRSIEFNPLETKSNEFFFVIFICTKDTSSDTSFRVCKA